jgi:DNA-binding LacI/PurR family transcriptional regulator
LAIVGFDNIAFARFCHPPLTTVAQPITELGEKAIELMLGLLADDAQSAAPGRNVTLKGELIVRASSGW